MIALSILKLVIILSASAVASSDLTIVFPTPELPTEVDPAVSVDVFSNHALIQMHRSLFKLNSDGVPLPDLVLSFDLDNAGKRLTIILADNRFSDGSKLSAKDVKASLERAIGLKTNGFNKYAGLIGYDTFISGNSATVSGIKVVSDKSMVFEFNKMSSKFIFALADLRFAIIKSIGGNILGLGDFMQSKTKTGNFVELERKKGQETFNRIRYVKVKSEEMGPVFRDNKYVASIFSPGFASMDKPEFNKYSDTYKLRSWKNYIIVLNSKRIKDADIRRAIFTAIDRDKIVQNCFPGEKIDNNILPVGFPGYTRNLKISKSPLAKKLALPKLKLAIFDGVGSEKCLADTIGACVNRSGQTAKIEVMRTTDATRAWSANELDGIVLYLESELNMDMLQFFSEDADFTMGPRGDKFLGVQIKKLTQATDLSVYADTAKAIQTYLLENAFVLPLFIPKDRILLSKGLKLKKPGIVPPTYFTLEEFQVRDIHE